MDSNRQQREQDKFVETSAGDTAIRTLDAHDASNPLPVADANKLTISNAIDNIAFDLNAAAFNSTTDIDTDYMFDSLLLNFSTAEAKTITVLGPDGTILWGGDVDQTSQNLGYNTTAKHFNLIFGQSFDADDNITVQITQFSSAGTCDVILKIQQGTSILGSGGTTVTNDVTVIDKPYIIQVSVDSSDSNLSYVGQAVPGTATSASDWQIKRIDETTGTIVLFAGGVSTFTAVWDNRESLSYS